MDDEIPMLDSILEKRLSRSSWAGGRGKFGPLGVWLLEKKLSILVARQRRPGGATWIDIAEAAARDGVRRQDGTEYGPGPVRTAWARLMPDANRSEPKPTHRAAKSQHRGSGEAHVTAGRETITSSSMPPVRRFGDNE